MLIVNKYLIVLYIFTFMSCADTIRVQTPNNIGSMEIEQKPEKVQQKSENRKRSVKM